MKIVLITAVVVLFALHSFAAKPQSPVPKETPAPTEVPLNKETARKVISIFRQDPLSPRGRAAGAVVRAFAEKSDDVILEINEKRAPFLLNLKIAEDDRILLLAAFILGNVDSQLLRNEKKDDPYAGELEVINVYKQMKKSNPAINLPEIDHFIDLEKRGELKGYIESP